MKRVLYIGGFTMPDGNAAAQRVLGVAKAMRECDCEVRFCGLSRIVSREAQCGTIDGFDYINYPYPSSAVAWMKYLTGRDASISAIEAFDPQVVVLYNHPAFAIEHIARYCKKRNIKVLADVTEWYEPQGGRLFKVIKGFDVNRRMHKSHLKLDGLICISSYLTKYYRDRGVNVLELPPLVDVEQSKWHQTAEQHKGELRMVYAGSPGSSKDRLDIIINALDEIVPELSKPFRFDVIGITKQQYMDTWSDSVDREYVVFHGRRPHEEVIKMLLEADFQIFLRPDTLSNRAGFPTKFVETITSGTLPITNLSSNLVDYLHDGQNGFVIDSLDRNAIESTLKRVVTSSSDKLKDMMLNIERTRFDFHNYVDKCKNILFTPVE